ncbi:MAG: hypothetical protein P8184_00805 [Calditrichia bacterium]
MAGCKDDVNQVPPPARVELAPKTAEAAFEEHGIDAVPETDGVFLEWYPNSGEHLAGYKIYRSESGDKNYEEVARINKQYDHIDTSFTDTPVSLHQRYYYYLRAFDDQDQDSEPSDTVSYELLGKPLLNSPINEARMNNRPGFQWSYPEQFPQDRFVFRLEKIQGNEHLKIAIAENSIKYEDPEKWSLPELGATDSLFAGRYRWRIDQIGFLI